MPITFAHPIAVAPLARTGLPIGALVVGTVVPDLPLFARAIPGLDRLAGLLSNPQLPTMAEQYRFLHSPTGLFTLNIVIGLAVLALWWWLLRPAYRDSLSKHLRGRTHARPTGLRAWVLAVPAIIIGSFTHIVWDQLTHRHTWLAQQLSFLQTTVAGIPLTTILQYGTGLLGVIATALWLHLRVSRRNEHTVPQYLADMATWMFTVPVVAGLAAVVTVLYQSTKLGGALSLEAFAFDALTTTVAATISAAIVMAVIHRLMYARVRQRARSRRRRR